MNRKQLVEKSFVFENEVSQQTRIIKTKIEVEGEVANLLPPMMEIDNHHLYTFKLYNFKTNKYQDLSSLSLQVQGGKNSFLIPQLYLISDIVLLKYSATQNNQQESTPSIRISESSSLKKQRSHERTIAEVIDIIKEWRCLHSDPKGHKKKLNLQEAADALKISKKSLDDYYYQLKLGEKYDFDFRSHLLDKIGLLRNFIKDKKKTKGWKKEKAEKTEKKLKVLDEISEIDLMPYRKNFEMISEVSSITHSHGIEIEQLSLKKDEQLAIIDEQKSVKSIEDQFYYDFEFMMGEPKDPFINLQVNFKKKNNDDLNS